MAQQIHIDKDRFYQLFHEYKDRIYGYVLSIAKSTVAAEELTQEVFVKIWMSRDLFDTMTEIHERGKLLNNFI